MKIRNTKLSKRTLALLAATAVLFGGGSYAGTRAALGFFSNELTAGFELDHMQVHLLENGEDVCHGNNEALKKANKYKGNLVEYLGYTNTSHESGDPAYTLGTPGKVEPGKKYREELQAQNSSDYDEYVRIIVHKYWVDKNGNKSPVMDPALIKLEYKDGTNNKAYNDDAWEVNPKEHTKESDTYYLKNKLGANETSAPLFNELSIDREVANLANVHTTTTTTQNEDDGSLVTVITYRYDYDDFTFYIEADVQAIQTHNAPDALESMWGVNNVSAGNGTLTVN